MSRRLLAASLFCMLPLGAPHAAADGDTQLNAAYRTLLGSLGDADQQRLRDAQRAWIAFRDKECSFRAQGGDGGSIAAVTGSQCIDDLSRQRARDLQKQIDCAEGDASCLPRRGAQASAKATGSGISCNQSAGKPKAALYADQCIQVSPATHPPCNGENACDLIIDEIRRGCAMIGKDAPAFCAGYAAHP